MSRKLTKEDLLKEFFKANDTVTVNARELQAMMTRCLQNELRIEELRKKVTDLKADMSIKDVTIQRLKLEKMQLEGSYELVLSA